MLIAGKKHSYSLVCRQTGLNNNVIVVGAPGAGKTRSIVIPNVAECEGSYIVTDPKGSLHKQLRPYMEQNGYKVMLIDFTDMEHSRGFNFFRGIKNEQDIIKVAYMLAQYDTKARYGHNDIFFEEAMVLLLSALISFVLETYPKERQNYDELMKLFGEFEVDGELGKPAGEIEIKMQYLETCNPDSFAVQQYRRLRTGTGKTQKSVLISLSARLGKYTTAVARRFLSDDAIDFTELGRKKTALFVGVSDTERSMDDLVNIFFSQAMNELVTYADKCCAYNDYHLPVPVRFIMDDFATNVTIHDMPRMIAAIRSRGISVTMMLQAESQLTARYGDDAETIIGSCDTYIYLGTNDINSAANISRRVNLPEDRIINMPVGRVWIFRRGERAAYDEIYDVNETFRKIEEMSKQQNRGRQQGKLLRVLKKDGWIEEREGD